VLAKLITPGALIFLPRIAFAGETTPELFSRELGGVSRAVWEIRSRKCDPAVLTRLSSRHDFLDLVGLTARGCGGAVGAGQAVEAFLQRLRATTRPLKAMVPEGKEHLPESIFADHGGCGGWSGSGTCARRRAALRCSHSSRGYSRAGANYAVYLDHSPWWRRPLGTLAALALPFFRLRARGNRRRRIVPRSGAPSSRHVPLAAYRAPLRAFATIAALSCCCRPILCFISASSAGFRGAAGAAF